MALFLIFLLVIYFIYRILVYYIDNGLYIPVSRRFAIRRYVFPKDADLQKKLCASMREVSKATFQGELPPYPFLHGDHSSLSYRVVCMFYERKDPNQHPIAVHAPFVTRGCNENIIHCGLMMVTSDFQRKGIQMLASLNLVLFVLFHRAKYAVTEIGSSSSFFSIQDKYMTHGYPEWKSPALKASKWHVDIGRFMMANHRQDFGCSDLAILEEDTLIVRGYCKDGGAVQFLKTNDSRKSRNPAKRKFIEDRLDNSNGDGQFFVSRPKPLLKVIREALL